MIEFQFAFLFLLVSFDSLNFDFLCNFVYTCVCVCVWFGRSQVEQFDLRIESWYSNFGIQIFGFGCVFDSKWW